MFSFLSLFSCVSQSKKEINGSKIKFRLNDPILSKPGKRTVVDPETNTSRAFSSYIEYTPRLEPKITIRYDDSSNLIYDLQGNIYSGGLSIHNVKKIRIENEVKNDTLWIKNYVEIKRIPGKESATINGYNYSKQNKIKVPKDIKTIKIQLLEDFSAIPKRPCSNG